ncbi:hypothetical protein [Aeromonas sobria]|uniref:hypothetical protein n=1 Tax=Aeromonas sobria TaxID=646 RepID=UPI000C6C8B6E|nr:hypothetical protein [Aeromonas sobria]PKQ78091.1 hypothetical protein CJF47_07365 [Aeromonas sobria]
MARTLIQAATLAVSLTANSAQFSAAMDAAKAAAQQAQNKINSAFNAIGAGAAGLGTGLGSIKNAFAAVAPSALMAVGGIAAYTAAVVNTRMEMVKLANTYNITTKEAAGFMYMLEGTGVELEDLLDSMKEFGVKAQETLAAGGSQATVVSDAFKLAKVDMNEFLREGDPTKRLLMIRDIKTAIEDSGRSAAEVVNAFDEIGGDAGIKMFGVLKKSKEELIQMMSIGQQIGGSINYENITNLQAAAGQFIRISNDFLVGIVSRIAPLMTSTLTGWTQQIIDMLEKKGGGSIEEGFKSYIKEWSDTIFNSVTFVLEGMASLFDTIRVMANKAIDIYNAAPGSAVAKKYSKDDLTPEERKRDDANDKVITHAQQLSAQYERDAKKRGVFANMGRVGMDEKNAVNAANEAASQAYAERQDLNLKKDSTFDPNKFSSGMNEMVVNGRKAMDKLKETVDSSTSSSKPSNKINVLGSSSGSGSGSSSVSAELDALGKITERVMDQKKKIHDIVQKYNKDERSESKKKTDSEMEEIRNAYIEGRKIITDAYEERVKAAAGNKDKILELKRQESEALSAMSKEQSRDESIVIAAQHQRQLEESNEFIKQANRNFEKSMRRFRGVQGGTAGKTRGIRDEIKDLENEWDEKLEAEKKAHGKSSVEYQKLLDQKKEALIAYHEWEKQQINAQGEGVGQQLNRMYQGMMNGTTAAYGGMSSAIEGYTISDIQNMAFRESAITESGAAGAKQREEETKRSQMAQVGFMLDGTSQMMDVMSKHSKKMFYMKKALSIAEALINGAVGATEALKMGPIMGPVMAGMITALTGAQVGMIAAQQYQPAQGQAHDGLDSIPHEGTWRLDKGERVVSSSINKDLKQGLKKINGGKVGGITVDAPVVIQGSILDQGAVEDMLYQHTQHIVKITEEYKQDRGQ